MGSEMCIRDRHETGELAPATRLRNGDQIVRVVESTSPDALLRRIDQSLPNVDAVLLSVKDLSEDMRRLVNGPIASVANRVDSLVQQESQTVKAILDRADKAVARIDAVAADIRSLSGGADERVKAILVNLEQASAEAQVIASTASIADKIDEDRGTLGRLVNDPTIADNVEEITDDAKGFLGTLFKMQTYVGLRSEYNVFAGMARHYISVELHTRPDKYYLIEIERGPRGGYPDTQLVFDPRSGSDQWVRTTTIADDFRFTFQFAKRFDWLTLRYGIKESTGGVGADADVRWWNRGLRASFDVFDATFDQLPRVKLTAAVEVFRHAYLVGGIDDARGRRPKTLGIDHVAEFLDGAGDVEGLVLDGRHDQVAGHVQRGVGDLLVPGADDDLVDPVFRSFPGLPEAAGESGQILQFERHVFEDVSGPGAFFDPAQEAAMLTVVAAMLDQRGKPGRKTLVEAGNLVRRILFQFPEFDPGFEHWPVGPHVRTAQGNDVPDDDVFFLHAWSVQVRLAVKRLLIQQMIINAFAWAQADACQKNVMSGYDLLHAGLTGSDRAACGCAGRAYRCRARGTGCRGCRRSAGGFATGAGYPPRP